MAKENVITEENFAVLLAWLDDDQEGAAQKYEKIRQRLIRMLNGRGCFEAEELVDETFNRVTRKVHQLTATYVGEPALYFYGVADKIYLEWLRRQKKMQQLQIPKDERKDASQLEIEHECLESCLNKLPPDQRDLIVEYYREEKSAKIKHRQQLAAAHGVSANALQVKVLRLRVRLKDCLRACIAGKNHR